jgi:hypothetical protein
MKTPASMLPLAALVAAILLSFSLPAYSQTAAPDLDRDGIPNTSDRDVDNDGILNGADRNIDGGIAQSGPLRGRYIGDKLPNNSPQELDMDADGLADNALNETDIDGDGLADNALNETDIDGDGLADNALNETDIDGDGLSDAAVNETDIDGDGQLDNAIAETDIDGDGLADNAASETDIDGDGLADGVAGEVDTDGDGSANGLDGDVDGDGLANNSDAEMYGTGDINDIFQTAGAEEAYAPDASVASTIAYVSDQLRQKLQIPATDKGLRVRVQGPFGSRVTGVWRYLSSDNIQVWGKWSYPASDPSQLNLAVQWKYSGPPVTVDQVLSGDIADYLNPANYSISEESVVYSGYPGGGGIYIFWQPQQPASYGFSVPSEQATRFYQPLINALASLPNFTLDQQYLSFSADLGTAPGLSSLQTLVNLERIKMQLDRAGYGQLEAQQLR